jgi:(p)ppGpp synthase/HD superfamily hydrolase
VDVATQIKNLTVDRVQQWNAAYKTKYYKILTDGPVSAQIVKVFDKLDNMFLLGLNKDDEIRAKYLAEIERYVIPMAQKHLPNIANYMTVLSDDCKQQGYFGE